jgi:hypothetical protein
VVVQPPPARRQRTTFAARERRASVAESLEELLALPEEEAMTKATEAGAAFAAPGTIGTGTADLSEPGRYGIVCFIPVGATPDVLQSGEEPEGPPHFTEGMFAEITVE